MTCIGVVYLIHIIVFLSCIKYDARFFKTHFQSVYVPLLFLLCSPKEQINLELSWHNLWIRTAGELGTLETKTGFGLLGKGSGASTVMKKFQSGMSASRNLGWTLSDLCKYLAKLSNKQVRQTGYMRWKRELCYNPSLVFVSSGCCVPEEHNQHLYKVLTIFQAEVQPREVQAALFLS